MITIEDVKEFVELMSEAISLHNAIKDDELKSLSKTRKKAYDEVCEKLIQNQVIREGRIIEGIYPFVKRKPKTE